MTVYVDPKDLEYLKHEYALNLTNHRYEIDWLVGMVTAQKLGLLGVSASSDRPSQRLAVPGLEDRRQAFAELNSHSRLVMVLHRIDLSASRMGER